MKIKVTKDNLKIAEKDLVHKGEYNVNTLEFEFSDDYTGISKMAVFSTPLNVTTYEVPITNNTCIIPHEVLTQRGTLTIGVYGYTIEDEVINKRYSPNPVTIPIDNGSYISGASNAQEQEPTLFEEFVEQIEQDFDNVNDDLNVLAQSITDLDNAKQDKLTAGTNITIEDNVISSTAEVNAIDKIKVNNVEQPIVNKAVNISVPTKTSDISNDSGFITKEVGDLTNYELKTDTGHSIDMTIDSDYVLSVSLKNSAGSILNSKSVDLPLETMIVNGSYDSATKEVVLILDNGNEIRFSVADLVSGLQTEITPSNKLASDLVDDTNQTNKFVTSTDITTWNNKQNAITNDNKLSADLIATSTSKQFVSDTEKTTWNNKSDFSGSYNDLTDKPDLTIYEQTENKTNELSDNSTTTEYPNAKCVYDWLDSITPTNEVSGTTINVQDSSNLPLKAFSLGGNATQADTPTPDTPQNISVVTGDNTLKVLGKNWLNLPSTFSYTQYYQHNVTLEAGTYRLSHSNATSSDTTKTTTGLIILYNDNTTSSYLDIQLGANQNRTISLSKKAKALRFYAYGSYSQSAGNTITFTDIQLELGSTATTYEPYTEQTQLLSLGNIELAKIGTYQDKLFKAIQGNSVYDSLDSTTKASLNIGSWYKQGNVKKIYYDRTTYYGSFTNNIFTFGLDTRATTTTNNQVILCTKLKFGGNYENGTSAYNNMSDLSIGVNNNGTSKNVYIRNNNIDTANDFRTWLEGLNATYYYQLATPTYTEITDTTLIGQLEEILRKTTYKTTTNMWSIVASGNAEGELIVTYRQDIPTLIQNNTNAIISLGNNT